MVEEPEIDGVGWFDVREDVDVEPNEDDGVLVVWFGSCVGFVEKNWVVWLFGYCDVDKFISMQLFGLATKPLSKPTVKMVPKPPAIAA